MKQCAGCISKVTGCESTAMEALISIRPQYVGMITRREKSVDIRSGTVSLEAGTRLWIYSTLPVGRLEAVAKVETVVSASPSAIWQSFRSRIGISHQEFLKYANGSASVSAIVLHDVAALTPALSLEDIRTEIDTFRPPQRLRKIREGDPLLRFIRARILNYRPLNRERNRRYSLTTRMNRQG